MPGYSSTPTFRKLGLKQGHALVLVDAPAGWAIADLPEGVVVTRTSLAALKSAEKCDITVVFIRVLASLAAHIAGIGRLIHPAGAAWIAWPRRAAGHESDVTENSIRDAALPLGMVDVKVAAIDEDWSGLKIVWRREVRGR
jgi:hypothetical protein